jgi:hypothetical protein
MKNSIFHRKPFLLWAAFVPILTLNGCAWIGHYVPDETAATVSNPTNCFNHVFLYTPWFAGDFGNGEPAWNGHNYDNELVTGLHPSTKSEFDFKVRSYPKFVIRFDNNKTNFLREIAHEIEATNKIKFTSEKWETLPVTQFYTLRGKYASSTADFTFLCREGELIGPLTNSIYPISGKIHLVHYLTDIHSDTETNLSGTVFHATAFIPETVDSREREYLVSVMKMFIANMRLARDPKIHE